MDSFENRVNKAFGSLGTSSSWRLSDEQQARSKEWRSQQRREEEEEEEEEEGRGRAGEGMMDFEGDVEEEGRRMRCMVGLDATLDLEEEEDEFDKAAFGLEGNQERLYMMGVKEDGDKRLLTSASLPLSLYDLQKVQRDPRANHSAARARLEEDARGAMAATASRDSQIAAADVDKVMKSSSEPGMHDHHSPSEHLSQAHSEKPKPLKRVRFALDVEEGGHQETNVQKVFVRPKGNSDHASKVPDHIRNPSKYTHYTLDWDVEDNDMSNMEAYKACSENLRTSLEEECSSPQDTPQKIQYIHRPGRASSNAQKSDMEETNRSVTTVKRTMCIEHYETETENAANSSDDSMDSKREESVHMTAEKKLGKPSKNYRLKREALDSMDII